MASRRKNGTLVEQAVSKLLDPKGSKVSRIDYLLDFSQAVKPTSTSNVATDIVTVSRSSSGFNGRQKKNKSSAKKPPKAIVSKVAVTIAWILLALNMLLVMRYLGNGMENHPSLDMTEQLASLPVQITMLIFSTITLSFTTWLYWRNRSKGCIAVTTTIIIILLVSLVLLPKEPGVEGVLGRTLSQHLLAKVTPTRYRPVTGILYDENKPSALFDCEIVHEGDNIHGINVIKIHRDKVEFEHDGKRWSQVVEAATQ